MGSIRYVPISQSTCHLSIILFRAVERVTDMSHISLQKVRLRIQYAMLSCAVPRRCDLLLPSPPALISFSTYWADEDQNMISAPDAHLQTQCSLSDVRSSQLPADSTRLVSRSLPCQYQDSLILWYRDIAILSKLRTHRSSPSKPLGIAQLTVDPSNCILKS